MSWFCLPKLSSLIRRFIVLKRREEHDFWGNCPFHRDRTPSFHCNDKIGRYYCFGCKATGNYFDFVKNLLQLNNLETKSFIFKSGFIGSFRTKVSVVRNFTANSDVNVYTRHCDFDNCFDNLRNVDLLGFNKALLCSYIRQLSCSDVCKRYLESRGVFKYLSSFKLGYCRISNAVQIGKEFNISKWQLFKLGLVTRFGRDSLCGMLVFPIIVNGEVLSFSGRCLNELDSQSKYYNVKNNLFFTRSKHLFNVDSVQNETSLVVLTEGFFDVISFEALGYTSVSCFGSSVSFDQISLIKHKRIIVCFDNDDAGNRGVSKFVSLASSLNCNFKVAIFPKGVDANCLLVNREFGLLRSIVNDMSV